MMQRDATPPGGESVGSACPVRGGGSPRLGAAGADPTGPPQGGLLRRDRGEPGTETIAAIVAVWNEVIPRNRVRYLTPYRCDLVRAVLRVYSPDEIVTAVRHYAGQEWQRRRNAWKRFNNWMDEAVVTEWLEAAEDARQHREAADDRRRTQGEAQAAQAAEAEALGREFDALPESRRREILGRVMAAWPKYLTSNARRVRRLAIELWSKERTSS